MRANWSSRRVLVIVVVDGMSALMTGSNDDICIVNVLFSKRTAANVESLFYF